MMRVSCHEATDVSHRLGRRTVAWDGGVGRWRGTVAWDSLEQIPEAKHFYSYRLSFVAACKMRPHDAGHGALQAGHVT